MCIRDSRYTLGCARVNDGDVTATKRLGIERRAYGYNVFEPIEGCTIAHRLLDGSVDAKYGDAQRLEVHAPPLLQRMVDIGTSFATRMVLLLRVRRYEFKAIMGKGDQLH